MRCRFCVARLWRPSAQTAREVECLRCLPITDEERDATRDEAARKRQQSGVSISTRHIKVRIRAPPLAKASRSRSEPDGPRQLRTWTEAWSVENILLRLLKSQGVSPQDGVPRKKPPSDVSCVRWHWTNALSNLPRAWCVTAQCQQFCKTRSRASLERAHHMVQWYCSASCDNEVLLVPE